MPDMVIIYFTKQEGEWKNEQNNIKQLNFQKITWHQTKVTSRRFIDMMRGNECVYL